MDKFVTRKSAEKPKDPEEPSSQQSSSFSYEDLENQLDGS